MFDVNTPEGAAAIQRLGLGMMAAGGQGKGIGSAFGIAGLGAQDYYDQLIQQKIARANQTHEMELKDKASKLAQVHSDISVNDASIRSQEEARKKQEFDWQQKAAENAARIMGVPSGEASGAPPAVTPQPSIGVPPGIAQSSVLPQQLGPTMGSNVLARPYNLQPQGMAGGSPMPPPQGIAGSAPMQAPQGMAGANMPPDFNTWPPYKQQAFISAMVDPNPKSKLKALESFSRNPDQLDLAKIHYDDAGDGWAPDISGQLHKVPVAPGNGAGPTALRQVNYNGPDGQPAVGLLNPRSNKPVFVANTGAPPTPGLDPMGQQSYMGSPIQGATDDAAKLKSAGAVYEQALNKGGNPKFIESAKAAFDKAQQSYDKNTQLTKDYANKLDSEKTSVVMPGLSGAVDVLEKYPPGTDIPGLGLTGRAPVWTLSEEGKANRTKLLGLGNTLIQLATGAAMGREEAVRLGQAAGIDISSGKAELMPTMDDDTLRAALPTVIKTVREKVANLEAGVGAAIVNKYKKQGGTVSTETIDALLSRVPGEKKAENKTIPVWNIDENGKPVRVR